MHEQVGRPRRWWPGARRVAGVPVVDLLVATALLLYTLGAIVTGAVHEGPAWVTVPVAVLMCGSLLGRSRWPVTVTVVAVVAGVAQAVVGDSPGTLSSLVIYLVLAFAVAAGREEGPAVLGLVVLVGGLWVQEWLDHSTNYLFTLLVFGTAWLGGRVLRGWHSRATYAEQHQHDLARLAVVEERVRIARELHDVVANGLSVIAVQSDAAEAALAKDPVRAAEPLRMIRAASRAALQDMRQMLTVLRPADDDGLDPEDLRPARGLADLPGLVAVMQGSGLPLTASLPDSSDQCPAGVGLACYRIAQEGLTNVLKHAGPVTTNLTVRVTDGGIEVLVHNEAAAAPPPAAPGSGSGLLGLRERVHAAGGRLEHGPDTAGGFRLWALLPGTPR